MSDSGSKEKSEKGLGLWGWGFPGTETFEKNVLAAQQKHDGLSQKERVKTFIHQRKLKRAVKRLARQ